MARIWFGLEPGLLGLGCCGLGGLSVDFMYTRLGINSVTARVMDFTFRKIFHLCKLETFQACSFTFGQVFKSASLNLEKYSI